MNLGSFKGSKSATEMESHDEIWDEKEEEERGQHVMYLSNFEQDPAV